MRWLHGDIGRCGLRVIGWLLRPLTIWLCWLIRWLFLHCGQRKSSFGEASVLVSVAEVDVTLFREF